MSKLADYCIVGVHFSEDRNRLKTVRILPDTDNLLVTGLIMAREQIVAGIQRGMTFTTALLDGVPRTYVPGKPVGLVTVDGIDYLRLDGEIIATDDLGDLPEY